MWGLEVRRSKPRKLAGVSMCDRGAMRDFLVDDDGCPCGAVVGPGQERCNRGVPVVGAVNE